MPRPRSLPRSIRAPQAAGLLAFVLVAGTTGRGIRAEATTTRALAACADAFEASTTLRRLEPTRGVVVLADRPTLVRLEPDAGACVAVVAETARPVDLRVAIHASDGEVLAEALPGPTASAVACAHPAEVRYAVVRAPETASVALSRLAGSGPSPSPPPLCAARTPSVHRTEIDPGGPPGLSTDVAVPVARSDTAPNGLVARASHRVQSVGGVAVPLPIDAHGGRVLAIAASGDAGASLRLVDASGRVLGSDAVRSGVAWVFLRPEEDQRLRAYVRAPSPATVRVFEAAP